jgi:uncharacterized protein (TIGR02453 family)
MPGFPRETLGFLEGIAANNDKEWFTANSALYDASINGAKLFVETVGPRLREISPTVRYEARIGGSLPRVNNDRRNDKTKKPYKENFDLWFWHGDKKGWDEPGFYLRITRDGVWIAAGMMHILWPQLVRYRDAIVDDRSGDALEDAVAKINAAGRYQVGYRKRKSVPKGYDPDAPRAEYLKYESLWGHLALPAEAILDPGFDAVSLAAWRDLAPLVHWLLAEVASGVERKP